MVRVSAVLYTLILQLISWKFAVFLYWVGKYMTWLFVPCPLPFSPAEHLTPVKTGIFLSCPFFSGKVLLFSPPPVRLQALCSDSRRKYFTTKRHTQKTSYLLWSENIKPLFICPSAVSSFLKPQGPYWWFSPQLLISVWVLCPFSHLFFF